jgi:plasmid stability protein
MAILHVRNVPDDLYVRLQQRAESQRRSLSAEVITLLDWAMVRIDRASAAVLASVDERRFFDPASVGAPDSTTMLREDRDR